MKESLEIPLVYSNGMAYLEVDDWLMAIVIPSRKRSGRVGDQPWLPAANVLVHQSEEETYAAALEGVPHGALITHNEHGFCRLFNYLIERGYADKRCRAVLSIDDDIRGVYWMMTRRSHERVTKTMDLVALAIQHARCCVEAGIGVFGLNTSASPMARQAQQPFALRGWVMGGYFGVCDSRLRIHPDIINSNDVDLSLRSMLLTGMILIDQRYHFIHQSESTGLGKGGIADLRSSEVYDHDLRVLEREWPRVFEPLWGTKMPSGLTRHKLHVPK